MQCIYTGAYVYFKDYGAYAVADLFQCGNQILIQWMPDSWVYTGVPQSLTHKVTIGHGYHHDKRGVTVVPESQVEGEKR